ncbi:MAG: complex I subunit 5 family protein [Candidatus Izemoplasmataceae bacterium]
MIEQMPILILLTLLVTALVIPLLSRFGIIPPRILGMASLVFTLGLAFIVMDHVHTEEAFRYHFGGHGPLIGIEFLIDGFSALFTLFVLVLSTLIFVYSTRDLTHIISKARYERYYTLFFIMVFALLGIIYTNDLFNTYVFMEILSITACAVISIRRKKENYTAAFRYVMLNELASLSFLFGVALLYMVSGHTNFELVKEAMTGSYELYPSNVLMATLFMGIGLALKSALFPFHVWLPDAHSNAPSPSSAMLSAIVIKAYVIVMIKVLFRVLGIDLVHALNIPQVLLGLGVVAMIMGSVFAIAQKDIKRMLAYSSVAQIGYIVLGISLISRNGLSAAFFHIISHGFLKSALFLSAGLLIYHRGLKKIRAFGAIGYAMPLTMGVFAVASLGMIGIPLTSGFIAKLNLAEASLEDGQAWLLFIIVVSGILNALYYLPILITAFLRDEQKEEVMSFSFESVHLSMIIPVIIIGLFIVTIGVYPGLIMPWVETAVSSVMP